MAFHSLEQYERFSMLSVMALLFILRLIDISISLPLLPSFWGFSLIFFSDNVFKVRFGLSFLTASSNF